MIGNLVRLYKQKGVALITVMLIVALCAVIASQMTARLQVQMQRSANMVFNQQATGMLWERKPLQKEY